MPAPERADTTAASIPPTVGIDLGTTYSVIAYLDDFGRPLSIPNDQGDLLTPSAVLFDEDQVVVGREAVRAALVQPDQFADCFKRDMGSDYYHRQVRGRDVPPEVLSAFVLRHLKEDAERRLGRVQQAVITVPAFFDETRRKATQDAGRLAGWDVLDILNEPTAAALAFGHQARQLAGGAEGATRPVHRVLVYDLGGGTFDVTILEIADQQYRALATDGDVRLGGRDFDERLVEFIADAFRQAQGIDPRSDPHDAMQLWQDAQAAKHTLSQRSKATVVAAYGGVRSMLEVTRQQFEELTRDLLDRTETTTSLVIQQARLEWPQIDTVLLVGGASRMPMVAEMLSRVTGKRPESSVSPDEAVAHGAALYAGTLVRGGGAAPPCRLINVNSHSLGVVGIDVATRQRVNKILIPKNSPLPCRVVRTFATDRDDQRNVKVPVVEGESEDPTACIFLGECTVRDLPPALPQGTPVQVEFSYAANGRIAVSARVPQARQSAHVEIDRQQRRNLGDLDGWLARLRGVEDAGELAVSAGDQGQPVNLTDPSSVLRRLDNLFTWVGRAAIDLKLPRAVRKSQEAAQQARQALLACEAELRRLEQTGRPAADATQAMYRSSVQARVRTQYEQQKRLADFMALIVGRECCEANFFPDGCESVREEVHTLKDALS